MFISKAIKRQTIWCLLLIFLTGVARVILSQTNLAYHGILSWSYLAVYFQWLYGIRRRFIQKNMRQILTVVALLIISWNVIRFIKYDFVRSGTFLARQLWYVYYIPITLLPLFMFLAVLYIGKTDQTSISGYWKLLYVPAGGIVAGILTNDLHQKAFSFPTGFTDWESNYTYGPLYFAAMGILLMSLLAIVVVVFRRCAKRNLVRYLWIPVMVWIIGGLYLYLYVAHSGGQKAWLQKMFELPEFACLFFIGFWESLVLTHLIPSNTNHEAFFRSSSIHAGLTNREGIIAIKAAEGTAPTQRQLQNAERGPIFMEEGNILLKSHPVRGGHFYWMEDARELNRLNRELEETGDYLEEENMMLDASNKLEETRKRTEEQNRLYDYIAESVKPQLDAIAGMIESLPEKEDDFRQTMKYAGVLQAYIKRRSNLQLLESTEAYLSSDELRISVSESMEYIRLLDILCHAEIAEGYILPANQILFLYELFEAALEQALPKCHAVLVTLRMTKQGLVFYIEIGGSCKVILRDWKREEICRMGGKLQVEVAEESAFITFCLGQHAGNCGNSIAQPE